MATTKISFKPNPKLEEKGGLVVMGYSYAGLALKNSKEGILLVHTVCKDAVKGNVEKETVISKFTGTEVYFRVRVSKGAKCQFSYSLDGKNFSNAGDVFTAEVGRWIGAKMGLFCTRDVRTNDSGWMEVDWFRVEALQ